MSSYLSIYIVPKRKVEEDVKQHIVVAEYSRSTDLYEYFSNVIHPAYIGKEDKIPYTTITKANITAILDDFQEDLSKAKARLVEYEKYASNNPDYIQEIVGLKEYISDLQYWKDKASFIEDMINSSNFYIEGIEEVCCNID